MWNDDLVIGLNCPDKESIFVNAEREFLLPLVDSSVYIGTKLIVKLRGDKLIESDLVEVKFAWRLFSCCK